ncbi:MAG TPA: DotA/TraY family protein, partial [Gammaproteobacteria bacterium]|nr:DotA/TraY family protein [Gammaproteobacteria bacterium]
VDIYETLNANNSSTAQQATYSGTVRVGIPFNTEFADICGHYHVTSIAKRSDWDHKQTVTDDLMRKKAREIYQHKVWAMQLMYQNFWPLARQIVNEQTTPRDTHNRLISLPDQPVHPSGYRNEAITTYREILKHQVKTEPIEGVQHIVREGKLNGWLAAGSFYFALNQIHPVQFFSDIVVPPTKQFVPTCDAPEFCSTYAPGNSHVLPPPLRDFLQYGPENSYLGTRLWDAKIFLENDVIGISDSLNLNLDKSAQTSPLHNLQNNMLTLLQGMMSEQHNDPLIAQGRFGSSIMILSERAWLDIQNDLHTAINRARQGYTPITEEFMQHLNDLNHRGALAIAIYSIVWIIGAILAIYIPLVPYLIFTIAVVGWLLLVIEAIVAAPILAISFMLPTNDEMGKLLQGLLLLLNIVLRPVLMIFGFIFATRLYQAVVKLVNFGMLSNFNNLNTNDSMFAWVAVLALYATFIVALSNKSFSLIYALPDKILRWMGGIPEQTDPSQELHTAKSSMTKGADTVNKISLGIPERSFARLQSSAKQLVPPDAVS